MRELGYSLRRSPSLFIGTVGTILIALCMLGGGMVTSSAVGQATARWSEGVEFIVFMNPDATDAEMTAISNKLEGNPEVEGFTFFDQQEAYVEFQRLFNDSEISDTITVDDLPPSFRVDPRQSDSAIVETLADVFRDEPGVFEVVAAVDTIRSFEGIVNFLRLLATFIGAVMLAFALLLVYNTIRMTIFARRREVEVMRLVGASNWYIRMPFMTEGVLQGIIGGAITLPLLWLWNNMLSGLGDDGEFALLSALGATDWQVVRTGIAMIVLGAAMGAVASMFALSRFLDV